MKTCSIDGCEKRAKSRGWCSTHWSRWKRNGDPLAVKVIHGDSEARFWAKVEKRADCWMWTGSVNSAGYGSFRIGRENGYAHRWSYERFNAAIPDGWVIDHLCRNPLCVNPDHLEAVTNRENTMRGLASWGLTGKCCNGHDMTNPANVYQGPNYRACRVCRSSAPHECRANRNEGDDE